MPATGGTGNASALYFRREDFDGETLQVRRTAHEGQILEGTKTDHGEPDAGRVVPVPATLAGMLEAQINLNDPDCDLLFTTPTGRLWRERTFYRDLWKPAQEASGLDKICSPLRQRDRDFAPDACPSADPGL